MVLYFLSISWEPQLWKPRQQSGRNKHQQAFCHRDGESARNELGPIH